jgi:hypothetical protein
LRGREIDKLAQEVSVEFDFPTLVLAILAAGWIACMLFRMVAPSFVTMSSPFAV